MGRMAHDRPGARRHAYRMGGDTAARDLTKKEEGRHHGSEHFDRASPRAALRL